MKSLRDEINHEKISKANIQMDLRNKEECAQDLRKSHKKEMQRYRKELEDCLAAKSVLRAVISKELALINSE